MPGFSSSSGHILRRAFTVFGGLATVPGLVALALFGVAQVVLWLDRMFHAELAGLWGGSLAVPYDTATTLLSTLAAGALTTLGLVYSLVLVVFTTAAGNIGPRLLPRFTGDRINQVTAGLFGGLFLWALSVLFATAPSSVPLLGLFTCIVLAVVAVLQLILFVNSAARSVQVDAEVAEIATQLEQQMGALVADEAWAAREDVDAEGGIAAAAADVETFPAWTSGYLGRLDTDALADLATRHDVVLVLRRGSGDFVLEGTALARVDRPLGEARNTFEDALGEAIDLTPSRSPEADLEYAVNLLIEIALRALSPGVNDTYTAIACVDRFSAALATPVRRGLHGEVRLVDGEPRLVVPNLSLSGLIATMFGPLRRAAAGNVLMHEAMLEALERLHAIAEPEAARFLRREARLVIEEAARADLLASDIALLRRRASSLLRA